MSVWEINTGLVDQVAMLVVPAEDQVTGAMKRFGGDGKPLQWASAPRLESFVDKRRKRKPRGDISPFIPGALVLSSKAAEALGGFLSNFGQLLELDVDGNTEFFFNATNLVPCIDSGRSEKRAGGSMGREVFVRESIPTNPAVFKDPATARSRFYANEGGKHALESAAAVHGIEGLVFAPAGL